MEELLKLLHGAVPEANYRGRKLLKKLDDYYIKASPDYLSSDSFRRDAAIALHNMRKDPSKPFVHIQDLMQHLKAYQPVKQKSNGANGATSHEQAQVAADDPEPSASEPPEKKGPSEYNIQR